jgi:ABC-type nitrate/sulfonate/bicarbonate transport system substrate-binding protein
MPNSYLPQLAARALGIYEAHGLEVELVDPEPGPRNLDAVGRGDYDLCMTSVPYYLWARDENPDLDARFVFVTSRRIHMTAFAIEGRPAVHGRPIATFADLAGASFAVRTRLPDDAQGPSGPLSGVEGLKRQMTKVHQERLVRDYLALLDHLGVQPGPLVDVGLGSTLDAVVDGEADVAAEWIELGVAMAADAAAKGLSLRSLRFADAGVPGYLNGFIAGGRALRARPEALARFVAAVREAMLAVRDDPAPALELLAAELPDRDPATVLERWRLGEPAMFGADGLGVGTMDAEGWAASVDYHVRVNGTRPLDPATVYDLSPALSARSTGTG